MPMLKHWQLNPLDPEINMHILALLPYIFYYTDEENLFNNQDIFNLLFFSYILITLAFD